MRRLTDGLRDSRTGRISSGEIWSRVRSAFAVLLSVGVLAGGGIFVYQQGHAAWEQYQDSQQDDYEGAGEQPIEVEIPSGTALSEISEILVRAEVVKTAKAFDREVKANANSKKIQSGRYTLKTHMAAKLALEWLLDPSHVVREWMTLTEGQWLKTQVKQMAKATELPAKQFEKALKDLDKIGLPKWALSRAKTAEGFLFPDSYELPTKPKAIAVIKLTTKRFNSVAKQVDLEGRAKALSKSEKLKLSAYDLVVVASIIEREVFLPEDRPKVARVIYNRLKAGQPLGMSSTVAYAVGREGDLDLSTEQTKVNSPYNTYKNKGLPPGPISSPGQAALEAAAHPAKGNWRWFVTVNPATGETVFSDNESDWSKAVDKYKAWCDQSDANYKVCYGKDR
ncbi:MAG: endolytic transglycosylase MltG [Propionicimonas sp.]|nr:endolytic transglycosylase MltG [Propionicimonas sp.]